MNKKNNIMSLSMEPEMQEHLKNAAKKKQCSVSKLIRDMVVRYLPASEEDVHMVILKIPAELKGQPEEVRKWLDIRTEGIVKAIGAPKIEI